MDDRCAVLAAALGEPLAGTAVENVSRWLLLEDRRPWRRGGFDEAELPGRERITAALARHAGVRTGLIRQPRPGEHGHLVWFADAASGAIRRVRLAELAELADLDWDALLEGRLGEPWHRPLYLVCTHGKRDACCAIEGTRTWTALSAAAPGDVWQSSHLGGHRYAPCVLALPQSVYYGQVSPEEAADLVAAHGAGALHRLDRVRGRTTWPRPAQAAEVFARAARGATRFDAVTLHDVAGTGPWTVTLAVDGVPTPVRVWEEVIGTAPPSCGASPAPVRALRCAAG